MDINKKLLIVVMALIILPPLTLGLQIYYQRKTGNGLPGPVISSVTLLAKQLSPAVESGNFSAFSKLPEEAELLIKNDAGQILFRTPNAADDLFSRSKSGDYHVFGFDTGKASGTAFLKLEGNLLQASLPDGNPIRLTVGLLFIVLIGLPILILHGFNKSIAKLEQATVKIASGNLDFPSSDLHTTDLASLGLAMDKMRLQLKEDRERRDRFIMGVSHDLKTPLAVIQGYIDALNEGLADTEEKKKEYYEILVSRADLLGSRITHLINLAKTSTSEWRHSLAEMDLPVFMTDTFVPLADYCAIRGCTLESRITLPAPCPVLFDPDMLERVFENLIANAVAYGSKGTPIIVSAAQNAVSGTIEIRVENEGQGISPENRQKIFEPFFRADKGRNDGGFGLGLASVKSIIETHGWKIEVESDKDGRTAFIITIPA